MIFGSVRVSGRAVETHRDTYLLAHLTVISVRRPFLLGALLFAGGGTAFGVSFGDLLFRQEIAALAVLIIAGLWAGICFGQIQLLSRDLRGSQLACMIWGTYGHLGRVRREIVVAMQDERNGPRGVT